MMRHLNVLIVSLLVALPAAGQIYQWKDAQGQTHFSDTPPPNAPVKTLREAKPRATVPTTEEAAPDSANGEGAPPAPNGTGTQAEGGENKADPAKPKTLAEKEAEFRQRRAAATEAAEKAAKERQRAEEMRRSCEQARGQLTALQTNRRMARYNASGERELLDDAARSAELERTQKFIADNCN